MFCDKLQKRIDLLDQNLVLVSDCEVHLTEKGEGKADLTLHLQNPCILFCGLEDHKLGYFKNQKCADYVLYECSGGQWSVHIFELKRTMSESSWKKTRKDMKKCCQRQRSFCLPFWLLSVRRFFINIWIPHSFRSAIPTLLKSLTRLPS